MLGLADGPFASAPLVTAPVLLYVKSDDDQVHPDACRALFDALGSADKTLVQNPGGHLDLPRTSVEEAAVWLDQKLAESRPEVMGGVDFVAGSSTPPGGLFDVEGGERGLNV